MEKIKALYILNIVKTERPRNDEIEILSYKHLS